ncbi:MAG: radical SAM protein [Candidatus Riflebacteria bacterium]|nr:radical SAM protein [Candidatus Riflebacteria bacterium]
MSVGLVLWGDGVSPRWRPPVALTEPIGGFGTPLAIFKARFQGIPGVDGPVLLVSDRPAEAALLPQAASLDLPAESYEQASTQDLPWYLTPERWGLEDDFGLGTWAAAPLAALAAKRKWKTIIVVALTSLLVDRSSVEASLAFHRRDGFDVTFPFDRLTGANWTIFDADLLRGMQASHAELMATRGGLAWALRKPLYPIRVGEFHAPRDRPRIPADLRLVDHRVRQTFATIGDSTFPTREFSYFRWLKTSGWEAIYCDQGPRHVVIEPTNRCEGRCHGCPQPVMQRARGSMDPDLFRRLVETLGPTFDGRFVFSGMGEPLAHPQFASLAEMVRGRPSLVVTSLSVAPSEPFPWDAFSHVRISVDALERQGFETWRPGCQWPLIEAFVAKASVRKREDPDGFPELGVSFLKHARNDAMALGFLNYWGKVCQATFRNHFFRWPLTDPPDQVQWYQILGASDFLGQIPFPGVTRFCPVDRRPCLHALQGLHVLWDGTVVACPFDYEGKWPLGNLNRQSGAELWAGEPARQFRRMHLAMEFPDDLPCKTCQDWYQKT